MVLSFFRRGESGMEHVTHRVVEMLADARRSFDLATSAVLVGAPPASVSDEIWATDQRINRAEQELRRELMVHITVQGADDIGDVLSYTLLIKKVERIGDQAKNMWDLADEGVNFAGSDDVEDFLAVHHEISAMFGEVADLLLDPDPDKIEAFRAKADRMRVAEEAKIRDLMHSGEPGHYAVPRAVLHRYLKRIIANIGGIMTTLTEPVQTDGDEPEDDTED
jgi:phosphate uptake regulator